MRETFAHYAAVGYSVPSFVNPVDFYLDLVSPSYAGQEIDAFVTYYEKHCAADVMELVQAQLSAPGVTSSEIMQHKLQKSTAVFGPPAMPVRKANSPPHT
jgi:hypothetical protein